MVGCHGSEVLHQEIIELLAQVLISSVLRKMTQQKRPQHRFLAKVLALQQLPDLCYLHLVIDLRKPTLNALQDFVRRAINRILQVLTMGHVELKFPNQRGIKRIEPARGAPFSGDLNQGHSRGAHALIIQLGISVMNLTATSVSEVPICTAATSASASSDASLFVSLTRSPNSIGNAHREITSREARYSSTAF